MRGSPTLGTRFQCLYKVNGRPLHALIHENSHQCELWHWRFSHLHYKALPHVRNMVSGMSKIRLVHDGFYQWCASVNRVKGLFPLRKWKVSQVLHLAHFDLCGPMLVTTFGGYLYYLIFVDDFSCENWIFFLKTKGKNLTWSNTLKLWYKNNWKVDQNLQNWQ